MQLKFQCDTNGDPFENKLNLDEIPMQIEIIRNPVEISMKYQLKSIGNPVEIQ